MNQKTNPILRILEKLTKWFYMISPALYTVFNWFFILKPEQRTWKMGIAFTAISILYFCFCVYFFWINKDIYNK